MLQSSALRCVWSHLPKRKGLASGIVLSGYGAGAAVFGMFFQIMANPNNIEPLYDARDDNYYFPKEIGDRFPEIQLDLCLTWTLFVVISLTLVNNFKASESPDISIVSTNVCDVPSQIEANVPLWRIVFSFKFLSIYAMYVLHFIYIIYFISVYKEFG
jgi:hypothetical protein